MYNVNLHCSDMRGLPPPMMQNSTVDYVSPQKSKLCGIIVEWMNSVRQGKDLECSHVELQHRKEDGFTRRRKQAQPPAARSPRRSQRHAVARVTRVERRASAGTCSHAVRLKAPSPASNPTWGRSCAPALYLTGNRALDTLRTKKRRLSWSTKAQIVDPNTTE